jgi:hypothetical protein
MKKILIGIALFFFASALTFAGDSLADAAKKEKERRARITKPAKVITNKDIEDFKASGKVVGGTIEATGDNEGTAAEETAATEEKEPAGPDLKVAEQELADAQKKAEAAQYRAKKLEDHAKANIYNSGIDQLTGQAATDAEDLKAAQKEAEEASAAVEAAQKKARDAKLYAPPPPE